MEAEGEQIVIVGGGICGVCTAYFLLEAGVPAQRIALVEAHGIASKASGFAGGFLAQRWHAPPTAPLGLLSYDLHAELARRLDGKGRYGFRSPVTNLSLDVRGTERKAPRAAGGLLASATAEHTDDNHHAEDTALDSHSEVHKIIFRARPAVRGPAPASSWLDGRNVAGKELIGDPAGSAQVHPRRFCETVWAECEQAGVRLVRGEAQGLEGGAGGRRSLVVAPSAEDGGERDQTTVPFDRLVVAAGPWSGQLLQKLVGFEAGITNLPGHSVIIEPSSQYALPAEALFADIRGVSASEVTTGPELFVRPPDSDSGEGRTMVYAAGENTGDALPALCDYKLGTYDEEAIARLLKACALISPALAEGRVVSKALCYRPVTERGYPFVSGVPGHEGIFLLSGHGPWGISLGPGSGKVMAELVLGQKPSANVSQLGL